MSKAIIQVTLTGADLGSGFENRSSCTQIEGTTSCSLEKSGDTTLITMLTFL